MGNISPANLGRSFADVTAVLFHAPAVSLGHY